MNSDGFRFKIPQVSEKLRGLSLGPRGFSSRTVNVEPAELSLEEARARNVPTPKASHEVDTFIEIVGYGCLPEKLLKIFSSIVERSHPM